MTRLWLVALCLPLALLVYCIAHRDGAGALLWATVLLVYGYTWLWADRRRRQRRP